jgi:F-type H+-transporting ATPase subunit gamma
VIYNEFKSAITQATVVKQVLPVVPEKVKGADKAALGQDYDYEPSKQELLTRLVPLYVQIGLYRAALESIAGEFGARMSAMESATKNAGEMINKLTLQYNRARQAAITKELLEIIGGAEALKG